MTTVAGTSQYPQLALHSQYRFDEVVAAAGDSTGAEGGPAVAGVPAACPTLDLVATVTVGGGAGARELVLWRPGPGQVVSRSKGAPGVGGGRIGGAPERVEAVCWKPDGQFLAAAWSDGSVRLVGLESKGAAYTLRVTSTPPAGAGSSVGGDAKAESATSGNKRHVSFVGWARNITEPSSLVRTGGGGGDQEWRRALRRGELQVDGGDSDVVAADLPKELTFLEIETALPKISPLPPGGGGVGDDSQVFTTRQSLEFIFRSARPEDNELVDVMVVGTADGLIHLSLYDSFVVGGLGKRDSGLQLAGHSYHPESSTHALLFKPAASPLDALFLVPMDLCFIRSSPVNLSLLTSKMTTWQKLLRYISQVQLHMVQEWKSTRDLPNRFLRGIQEDLKEAKTGPKDIVQALYHLVVTGHTYPQVKEWLVDGLAERGHKRWDKAVVAGLQSVRSLAHENLIPALERTAVILSRLLGLARFHDGLDDGLGFTAAQISRMLDIVGALLLVANRVLMTVMDELDHFVVFSAWLRHEIDRQASSSSSGGAPASGIDELAEMDATLQHGKVLTYVRTYLVRSPLVLFLGDDHVARDDYQTDWQHVEGGESLVEMLDRQLAKEETGQPHMKALPRLEFLVSYLSSRSQKIFESIELNLKRGVRFEKPTRLSIGGRIRKYATRLCPGIQTNTWSTYTVIVPEEEQTILTLFCTQMTTINGVSSVGDTLATGLRIACSPAGGRIVDIGFLDTELLLVLWQERHDDGSDGPTLLLRIPYTASVASSSSKLTPVFTLPYQTYHPPSTYTSAAASAAIQIHDLSLSALTQALPSLPPLTVSPPPPLTSTSADDDHAKTEPTKTASTSFLPTRMEVLPASHARGHLPARVCLLGADGVSYVVFALPEPGAEPGEVAGPGSVGREAALPAEVADDEDTTMLSV